MVLYRLNNLKMPLKTTPEDVYQATLKNLQLQANQIDNFRIVKESLDARNKSEIYKVYATEFETTKKLCENKDLIEISHEEVLNFRAYNSKHSSPIRPIIIGSGPSGMMAALCLAEAGLKPLVIERGAEVSERKKIVDKFWATGELSPNTNVQFGEGGAGTFSDGKLMTGIKKDKYTSKVLQEFATAGAPKEILYLSKPHIGTDNLVKMVQNIRHKIETLGGEYRFNEKLEDIITEDDSTINAEGISQKKIKAIIIKRSDETTYQIATDTLILALGHSARDTFQMLYEKGFTMEQKPFAVGVRIEHKQEAINIAQYGKKFYNSPYLGAADYKLAEHMEDGRGVYTFCMCPGGMVVGATSLEGHVVTNGMSEFARNQENANSAILVNVDSKDFGSTHPLAGIKFQEELEKKAFDLGGRSYNAPVQTVGDFLSNRKTNHLGNVTPSYKPGVTPSDFKKLFPQAIYQALQEGIRRMDKKLRGFASPDAVLTAVESRSSSPVRIIRDKSYMSNIQGVYPIGEGAGYAGGITSAATDGVKVAAILCNMK